MNVAIVVAGGKGRRMQAEVPKQYLKLGDKTILQITLENLGRAEEVDRIVLVVPRGEVVYCRDEIVDKKVLDKVGRVVMGGKTRQESVRRGLQAIEKLRWFPDVVLIHDGVRPFVSPGTVGKAVRIAANFGAALTAIPVTDTIKAITDDGFVRMTPDRRWLMRAQTPQAFNYYTLSEAHQRAADEDFLGTDDCQLVERYGGRIVVVEGDERNIKITTPLDLEFARVIWRDWGAS